jgi:hypothetical protein
MVILTGDTEVLRERSVPVPLFSTKILTCTHPECMYSLQYTYILQDMYSKVCTLQAVKGIFRDNSDCKRFSVYTPPLKSKPAYGATPPHLSEIQSRSVSPSSANFGDNF